MESANSPCYPTYILRISYVCPTLSTVYRLRGNMLYHLLLPQRFREEQEHGEDFQTPNQHHESSHPFRQCGESGVCAAFGRELPYRNAHVAHCRDSSANRYIKIQARSTEDDGRQHDDKEIEKQKRHHITYGGYAHRMPVESHRDDGIGMDTPLQFRYG